MNGKFLGTGLLGAIALLVPVASAQYPIDQSQLQAGERMPLPNHDARRPVDYQPTERVAGASRAGRDLRILEAQEAQSRLAERVPGLRVDIDRVLGTPRFVRSTMSLLTGPVRFGRVEPDRLVREFVADNADLFEIDAAEIELARVARSYPTKHNGVTHLTFQQQIRGVDLFGCEFRANVARDGALINVSSTMLTRPDGDFAVPAVAIRPLEAIRRAAASIGIAMTADPEPLGAPEGDAQVQTWSSTPDFRTDVPITTRLVYFPNSRRDIRPAWKLVIPEIGIGNTYDMIVDATDGEVLWRWNQLHFFGGTQSITMRVYTGDSPAPMSPGLSTPTGAQAPFVPRTLLTIAPGDVAAFSPNHWIDDGGNETLGNNVDAHLDLNADNVADLPRPAGSPARTFDFTLDTTQEPTTYRNAAITQLFYLCNKYHDRLYEVGFDEASGNFQQNNFALGGVGNDRVQADCQDGSGVNNANFNTPADGSSGRMQMYVFNGPTPDRDGDLDADIVFHEYSHGLSNRLVGVNTLFGEQSGGMGEGWGDFVGMCLNAEAADNPNANYHTGGYSVYQFSGLVDNYYFGIRRFPYSTDLNKNPQTYADIDPAQQAYPPAIPRSTIFPNTADEVHNVGEVWAVTLTECRANLWATMGFAANQEILQLVVDGMKLSPADPNFLEARDGILQADLVNNGGVHLGALWSAFAKRGMGDSAFSPAGGATTTGIIEAFDMPVLIVFSYPTGIPTQLTPGAPTPFEVDVTGLGGDTPTPNTGVLHYRINGGSLTNAPMTELQPNEYAAVLPAMNCYDRITFYVSVDSTSGTVTDPASAPTSVREAVVYTGTTVTLSDNFQVDNGWTVSNGPGLTDGGWTRGVPVDFDRSDPPADFDGSGQCWVTDNDAIDSNSDVDGGTTTLTSPVFNAPANSRVSYAYWLGDNTNPMGPEDSGIVQMSTNGGGIWTTVRTYTTAPDAWTIDEIEIGVDIAASATMRLRFSVTDNNPGDVLEGGLDAFKVEHVDCSGGASITSFCPGDGSGTACPCGNNSPAGQGRGCVHSFGLGGRLSATGSAVVSSDTLVLSVVDVPATTTVLFFQGTAIENGGLGSLFGDGLLCASGSVIRLQGKSAVGGAASFPEGGGGTVSAAGGVPIGGGTFFYQGWYRNQQAFCTASQFNLTNALEVVWVP